MAALTSTKSKYIKFTIIIIIVLITAVSMLSLMVFGKSRLKLNTYTAPNGAVYSFSAIINGGGVKAAVNLSNYKEYENLSISEYTISLNRPWESLGEIKLSVHKNQHGMYYYIDSNSNENILFSIKTEMHTDTAIHHVNSGGIAVYPRLSNREFDSRDSVYLEGGVYLKLGQISQLKDLSNTVYSVAKPKKGVSIKSENSYLVINIPLEHKPGHRTVSSFAICGAQLVNWDIPHVKQKILNLDSTKLYHTLSDGMYQEKPTLYEPFDTPDTPQIYKSVAAYHLKSSSEPDIGAYFKILSASLMYSHLNSYNAAGYISTAPCADWLNKDYGLGRNFFDTRFNFDTIDALLYAAKSFSEPAINATIKKALDFFIDFAEKNRFTVGGCFFVPDYGHSTGERSSSHCSLNHYLTEAITLIRGGLHLKDFKYCKYGYDMLNQINRSAKSWIQSNNDLWYSISPAGVFERDDYIDVTYNDLRKADIFLIKLGVRDDYPGLSELISAKESWLIANGHEDLTRVKVYAE